MAFFRPASANQTPARVAAETVTVAGRGGPPQSLLDGMQVGEQVLPGGAAPPGRSQQIAVLPLDLGPDQSPGQAQAGLLVRQGAVLSDAALHLPRGGHQ